MADRLYLSLWYPNFRLEALPDALLGVLRQFAQVGAKRVSAASAYPLNFTESPTYQRIYVVDDRATQIDPFAPIDPASESDDLLLEAAVAEATEQLHDAALQRIAFLVREATIRKSWDEFDSIVLNGILEEVRQQQHDPPRLPWQ